MRKPTSCMKFSNIAFYTALNLLYKIKYTANFIMNQMEDAQIKRFPQVGNVDVMITHIKSNICSFPSFNICISTNPEQLYNTAPSRTQILTFSANTHPLILDLENPRIIVFQSSCRIFMREKQA